MPAFPPSDTWVSLVACAAFEATLLFLCYHEHGPELAKRGPSILGRWLKPKANNAGPASVNADPPPTVALDWRLGALHERFFRFFRGDAPPGRDESTLPGAGHALPEVKKAGRKTVDHGVLVSGA